MSSHPGSNWSRIGRDVFTDHLKWFAAVWAVVVLAAALVVGVVAYFGTPTISIVDAILNSPRYWLFVVGLVFTVHWLGGFVAGGVTRRDFALGGLLAGLGWSVCAGAMCAVTMFAEGRLYAAAGWKADYEQAHMFDSPDQLGLMLVEYCVVFAVHFFAGWLLGTLYYRYGPWATVAAIPVAGFAAGTEAVLGSGWAGRLATEHLYAVDPSWPAALGLGAGVVVLLYAMVWRALRDIAIAPKKS